MLALENFLRTLTSYEHRGTAIHTSLDQVARRRAAKVVRVKNRHSGASSRRTSLAGMFISVQSFQIIPQGICFISPVRDPVKYKYVTVKGRCSGIAALNLLNSSISIIPWRGFESCGSTKDGVLLSVSKSCYLARWKADCKRVSWRRIVAPL